MEANIDEVVDGGFSEVVRSGGEDEDLQSSSPDMVEQVHHVSHGWGVRLLHPCLEGTCVSLHASAPQKHVGSSTSVSSLLARKNKKQASVPELALLVVGDGGEEHVVDVEDPRVLAVAAQLKGVGEEEDDLLGGELHVDLVLRRGHVPADVVDALAGHHLEATDVVQLHVHPPALAVVLPTGGHRLVLLSLAAHEAQDVPVTGHQADVEAKEQQNHSSSHHPFCCTRLPPRTRLRW